MTGSRQPPHDAGLPQAGGAPRRVLLLQAESEEFSRSVRSELLPFVLGYLRQRGLAVEWWVVVVPPAALHAGGRFVVDLPPERRDLLLREIGAWRPDLVLLIHREVASFEAALREVAPALERLPAGLQIGVTTRELDARAGLAPVDAGGDRLLVDAAVPAYERRWVFAPAVDGPTQPTRLLSRARCVYRASLEGNRFYQGLRDAPEVAGFRGCAFCRSAGDLAADVEPAVPFVELTLDQVQAHQRVAALTGEPCEYLTEDSALPLQLDRLADGLAQRGLAPSTFYLMMRADRVLEARGLLLRALERLAAGGHRLRLLSTGLESFSPDENERFNKGVSVPQIWACLDLFHELEARFPGTFQVHDQGYFSPILVSPWTRLADLRANFEGARRLGDIWLTRALGTRLQLKQGTPIEALARRDGLTAPAFEGLELDALCLSDPDERETPWRFADPVVARAHALLIRLDPLPPTVRYPADDPLLLRVRCLRQGLPVPSDLPLVDLCLGVVDAVEALGAEATPEAVFEHVLRGWLAAHPADPPGRFSYRDARRLVRLVQRLLDGRRPGLAGVRPAAFTILKPGADYQVRLTLTAPGERTLLGVAGGAAAGDDAGLPMRVYGPDGPLEPAEADLAERLVRSVRAAWAQVRRGEAGAPDA